MIRSNLYYFESSSKCEQLNPTISVVILFYLQYNIVNQIVNHIYDPIIWGGQVLSYFGDFMLVV